MFVNHSLGIQAVLAIPLLPLKYDLASLSLATRLVRRMRTRYLEHVEHHTYVAERRIQKMGQCRLTKERR